MPIFDRVLVLGGIVHCRMRRSGRETRKPSRLGDSVTSEDMGDETGSPAKRQSIGASPNKTQKKQKQSQTLASLLSPDMSDSLASTLSDSATTSVTVVGFICNHCAQGVSTHAAGSNVTLSTDSVTDPPSYANEVTKDNASGGVPTVTMESMHDGRITILCALTSPVMFTAGLSSLSHISTSESKTK